jgi:PAS domain S-box-containing protein
MENMWSHLARQSKTSLFLTALILDLFIGSIDYASGRDVSVTILYLIPIFLAVWFAGRKEGVVISFICIVTSGTANYFLQLRYSTDIFLWNLFIAECSFLVFVALLAQLKKHILMKNMIVDELRKEIDEREKAKEALRESEHKYKSLFDTIHDGIFKSSSDGHFLLLNPAGASILGYSSAGEAIGQSAMKHWENPEDREHLIEILKNGGTVSSYPIKGRKRDGSPIIIELSATISADPKGEIGGFEGTFRDITERRQAEIALRESEDRFHNAFEYAAIGMALVAPDGRWLKVNKSLCSLSGYSEEELLTMTFQDITHPDDLSADLEFVHQILAKTILTYQMEKRYFHKSGRIVWILVSVSLIRDSQDNPLYFISQIEDITDRKRSEEELAQHRAHLEQMIETRTSELSTANKKLTELDRLKSMFIASMSHELRTPLNSIIGFTSMTLSGMSGELNEEQTDNLTRAHNSARHLLNLITDIIDISKIEAGRIEAFPETIALSEVVDDALTAVAPQLKDKGLTLEIDMAPDIRLVTDRKRLLQCLINFMSNAVKYSERGVITVSSRKVDKQVYLSVSDTGIGIAEKDMHRLFEPFERLETHLRVKAGGTGLGLYLTKKLVTDILMGQVSVRSVEGKGSTFSLMLPDDIRQA